MPHVWTILAVAIGGAAGSLCRYFVTVFAGQHVGAHYGTLAVNLLGCLIMGYGHIYFADRMPDALRIGLLTGMLGALTTFSTLCLDQVKLQNENILLSFGYIIGSLALGILLIYAGMGIANWQLQD